MASICAVMISASQLSSGLSHMRHWPLALLLASALGLWPLAGHAADYLSAAASALQKGDLPTAQTELRNAVRADPQNAAARFLLARVQLQLGDPVAAEQQARAAEARGYDKLQTTPLIGQALLMQNRAHDLLKEFRPTGTDNELDAEILVDRGLAQLILGDAKSAAASWQQAEQLDPANEQAWLAAARLAAAQGDTAGALARINHVLSAINSKSVEARVMKAQFLAENHDIPGAIALLSQVVQDSPPAIAARLARANLLIATNKFQQAKADDDAVLALAPANAEALYFKAVLLHGAHQDQAASALLQRLTPLFAQMPRGFYLQAVVLQSLGQLAGAADAASKYTALVPDDPAGPKLLARIEMDRRRPDRAAAALNKLAASGHADVQAYDMLARADLAADQAAQALVALRTAAGLAPKDPALKVQLGGLLLQTGHPDAAVRVLEAALSLAPKQPQIAEALFVAAEHSGDPAKPAAELATIRSDLGEGPVVENLQGLLRQSQFDLSGAQATFEAILQKHPDFLPAKINLARVLAMQGDSAGSAKLLLGILDKDPLAEPALTMLTQSFVAAGETDRAIGLLERAHKAAPDNLGLTNSLGRLYIHANKANKALDLVAASARNGVTPPVLLGLEVAAQLTLKQTNDARATLQKMLDADPRNLAVRRRLAALQMQAGDSEGARDTIKAGMAALPDTYQLYLDDALIDLKANGLPAALATADALYAGNRAFTPLAALKGDLYMAANRPADAAKAYQAAAATKPSRLLIGRLAAALQQAGKPAAAADVLKDWYGKHPDDVIVASLLSTIAINQRRYAEAKVYLEAIRARRPHDAGTLNNLAWVDQQLGLPGAQQLARQAYMIGPSPETADTLGWILTEGGNPASGAVLLREASANSDDPRIRFHYAVALKDTGQKAAAVKLLQQVAAAQGSFDEKTQARHLLSELGGGS